MKDTAKFTASHPKTPFKKERLFYYLTQNNAENQYWENYLMAEKDISKTCPSAFLNFTAVKINIEMENVRIRKVRFDEIEQLQKISRQTFFETFASGNTAENMRKYLEEGFSIEKLTNEMNDKNAEIYFAELSDKTIGYLKLNFGESQTELKDNKAIEIERIYVLQEFHGKKVGQVLYEKAMQVAKERNANYVWLGVWEENPRAINFYRKNGFVAFDKHLFKLGDDEQTDIMMKKPL